MSELPQALPAEAISVYQKYFELPLADRSVLKNKVHLHLEKLIQAALENEYFDITLARALGEGLDALLEQVTDEQLPHAQAAVVYFVESEDATPDLDSITGFDDDTEVFNAVCEHLGLSDIKVEI